MASKYKSSDAGNFIMIYYFDFSILLVVANLLLCLIHKLSFTVDTYVWENTVYMGLIDLWF